MKSKPKLVSSSKDGVELQTSTRHTTVTDEWIVRCWVDEERRETMDYFTDDKEDAELTEKDMHKRWRQSEQKPNQKAAD